MLWVKVLFWTKNAIFLLKYWHQQNYIFWNYIWVCTYVPNLKLLALFLDTSFRRGEGGNFTPPDTSKRTPKKPTQTGVKGYLWNFTIVNASWPFWCCNYVKNLTKNSNISSIYCKCNMRLELLRLTLKNTMLNKSVLQRSRKLSWLLLNLCCAEFIMTFASCFQSYL